MSLLHLQGVEASYGAAQALFGVDLHLDEGEVLALMGPDIEKYGSPTIRAVFDEYFEQFPPYEETDILRMMAKRSFYAREWSMFLDSYPLVLCPFLPQPFFAPDRDTIERVAA